MNRLVKYLRPPRLGLVLLSIVALVTLGLVVDWLIPGLRLDRRSSVEILVEQRGIEADDAECIVGGIERSDLPVDVVVGQTGLSPSEVEAVTALILDCL